MKDKKLEEKTDAVMKAVDDFGNPGGITRELTRKLILEKGFEAADKTIASFKKNKSIEKLYKNRSKRLKSKD